MKREQQELAFQFVLLILMFNDVCCDHVFIVFCLSAVFTSVTGALTFGLNKGLCHCVLSREINLRNVDFIFKIFFVPKLADYGYVVGEKKY